MSTTPKSLGDDSLAESWVDISVSPGRLTPVTMSNVVLGPSITSSMMEEYMKLLKDAQSEKSSARVSLASSRRDSRCESPKSPPNSPNPEVADAEEELKGVYINKEPEHHKEWLISYLKEQCTTRKHGQDATKNKTNLSLRSAKFGGKGLFSKEVMATFFISNILSLIIGAGIGVLVSKKTLLSHYPMN